MLTNLQSFSIWFLKTWAILCRMRTTEKRRFFEWAKMETIRDLWLILLKENIWGLKICMFFMFVLLFSCFWLNSGWDPQLALGCPYFWKCHSEKKQWRSIQVLIFVCQPHLNSVLLFKIWYGKRHPVRTIIYFNEFSDIFWSTIDQRLTNSLYHKKITIFKNFMNGIHMAMLCPRAFNFL